MITLGKNGLYIFYLTTIPFQKQSSIGVFRKKCSENVQQIYRITPMQKCDLNKVAKQIYFYIIYCIKW